MNFETICRVCIGKNSRMFSIFEAYNFSAHYREIFKVITDCANVQIEKFDGFSQQICHICLDNLSQAYSFKKLCEQSDSKFRNNLITSDKIQIKSEFFEDSSINFNEIQDDPQGNLDENLKTTHVVLIQEKRDQFDDEIKTEEDEIEIKQEELDTVDIFEGIEPSAVEDLQCAENEMDSLISIASDSESIPSDVEDVANKIVVSLLPEKSKEIYEQTYTKLKIWCSGKGIKKVHNEKVLLAYFEHLSKQRKPSTLWVYYSMLRSMITSKENVDISKYVHLIAFLKGKSKGYRPKKSQVLRRTDISKFLLEAADNKYLLIKVTMIIGLAGACRREELTNLRLENITDEGQCIRILIPNTKTKISREFFVTPGNLEGIDMVDMVRRYRGLRPDNADHNRFFINYRNGRCTKLPVGINTIGKMPNTIASYLNLPNSQEYTGHCFRRSSASLLADAGVSRRTKTIMERYIGVFDENTEQIPSKVLDEIASTSH